MTQNVFATSPIIPSKSQLINGSFTTHPPYLAIAKRNSFWGLTATLLVVLTKFYQYPCKNTLRNKTFVRKAILPSQTTLWDRTLIFTAFTIAIQDCVFLIQFEAMFLINMLQKICYFRTFKWNKTTTSHTYQFSQLVPIFFTCKTITYFGTILHRKLHHLSIIDHALQYPVYRCLSNDHSLLPKTVHELAHCEKTKLLFFQTL